MKFTSVRAAAQILILLLCLLSSAARTLCAHPTDAEKHSVNLEALATTLDAGLRSTGVKSVTVADFVGANGRDNGLTWYLSAKVSDALRKNVAGTTGLRFVSRATLTDSKLTAEEMSSPEALARVGA